MQICIIINAPIKLMTLVFIAILQILLTVTINCFQQLDSS